MTRCRDVVTGSMVRRLWGGSEWRRGSDSPQEEWGNVCKEMSSPSPPEGGQDSSGQALGTGYGLAAPKTALGMLSLLKGNTSGKVKVSEVSRSQSALTLLSSV